MSQLLTPSELRVLEQASRGLSVAESARETFHAKETIKYHRSNILRTLDAKNMTHAVAIGYQTGLLDLKRDAMAGLA